ncbi:hypothetical protein AAFN47_20295 [Hoeflea sp. CAU 1731]
MASILLDTLADQITEALEAHNVPHGLTLIERTVGEVGPAHNPGPATTTEYDCRGWVDSWTEAEQELVETGDIKVIVLQSSLSLPADVAHAVKINDQTFNVVRIDQDPAGALWIIHARPL